LKRESDAFGINNAFLWNLQARVDDGITGYTKKHVETILVTLYLKGWYNALFTGCKISLWCPQSVYVKF